MIDMVSASECGNVAQGGILDRNESSYSLGPHSRFPNGESELNHVAREKTANLEGMQGAGDWVHDTRVMTDTEEESIRG